MTILELAGVVFMQITVVVFAAWLASATILKRDAATRHGVWLLAAGCVLLSPVLAVLADRSGRTLTIVPAPQSSVEPETALALSDRPVSPPLELDEPPFLIDELKSEPEPELATIQESAPPPFAIVPAEPERAFDVEQAAPAEAADGAEIWGKRLAWIWGAGTLVGLARIATGWGRLRRLQRSSRPFEADRDVLDEVRQALGVSQLPMIRVSPIASGPLAVGALRPCVILPEALVSEMTPSQTRDVLIHECAHAIRRDPLIGWLQRLTSALYWPHPLVSWLNHQLAQTREEVCDNFVIRRGDPCVYARTLLDLTMRCQPMTAKGAGIGLTGARWTLRDRVAGLLDPARNTMTQPKRWIIGTAAVALLVLCAATGTIRTTPAQAKAADAPQPESQTQADEPKPATTPDRMIQGMVVDDQGRPVANAVVVSARGDRTASRAATGADGSFRLGIVGPIVLEEDLIATADGGRLMGLGKDVEPTSAKPADAVRIAVKPSRTTVVQVRDADGMPVAGASVAAVGYEGQATAVSDSKGTAILRTPAEAKVHWVVGFKGGAGFDYYENATSNRDEDRFPLPAEVKLLLNGARLVRVKAMDQNGMPLPNLKLRFSTIMKPSKSRSIELDGCALAEIRTDQQGIAVIDWIPVDLAERTILSLSFGSLFHTVKPAELGPRTNADPVEIKAEFVRGVSLRGVVRQQDGSPADRVLIQAEGMGLGFSKFHAFARTREDGAYSLHARPNGMYMIGVVDDHRAARSLSGVVVREDKPMSGLDLTLIEGTIVRGRALRADNGRPASGEKVYLTELGQQIPKEFVRSPHLDFEEALTLWTKTDDDGRFQFRAGPGRYSLWPNESYSSRTGLKFSAAAEQEIAKELRMPAPLSARRVIISGEVIERSPLGNRPIPNARIQVSNLDGRFRNRVVADEKGRFSCATEANRQHIVFASDLSGKVASLTPITMSAHSLETIIVVEPASKISGRVMDTDRKPVPDHMVQLDLDRGARSPRIGHFLAVTKTGADGRYEFLGIPVSASADVSVSYNRDQDHRVTNAAEFERVEIRSAEPVAVPDLVIPSVEDLAQRPNGRVSSNLGPICRISGVVVDEQGQPISQARVELRRPGLLGTRHQKKTSDDGRFRFDAESGRWMVVIVPKEHAALIGTAVATPDRPVENQYVIGPSAYISGKAIGPDGKPVAKAAVGWVQPVDEFGKAYESLEISRLTYTAEDGTFRLGPLAPGNYSFTGLAEGPRRIGKATARTNRTDAVISLELDERGGR